MEHFPLPEEYGNEILRCEVGSTLHGTGLPGGEDHDEMGIYMEHMPSVFGFEKRDHYIRRSKPEGERSGPGDTDLTMFSLRKWAALAAQGNPSVLLLLFAPVDKVMFVDWRGADLRRGAERFASKKAGKAFLGYMEQQRQRLTGDRGRAGRVRVREDCPDCHGSGIDDPAYGLADPIVGAPKCTTCGGGGRLPDWKYAMHMLRLGYQGVEYLTYGKLTLPVPGEIGDHLRAVRRGDIKIMDIIDEGQALEERVKTLLNGESPLPDEPDHRWIRDFVIGVHLNYWEL